MKEKKFEDFTVVTGISDERYEINEIVYTDDTAGFNYNQKSEIRFTLGNNQDQLILDESGFTYMGKEIKDAGEAYDVFMKFMRRSI